MDSPLGFSNPVHLFTDNYYNIKERVRKPKAPDSLLPEKHVLSNLALGSWIHSLVCCQVYQAI